MRGHRRLVVPTCGRNVAGIAARRGKPAVPARIPERNKWLRLQEVVAASSDKDPASCPNQPHSPAKLKLRRMGQAERLPRRQSCQLPGTWGVRAPNRVSERIYASSTGRSESAPWRRRGCREVPITFPSVLVPVCRSPCYATGDSPVAQFGPRRSDLRSTWRAAGTVRQARCYTGAG